MKLVRVLMLVIIMVAFMATGAQAEEQKPVAEVMVGSYGLSWSPNVAYAKLQLTVATPTGYVFKKVFDSGSIPGFDLSNLEQATDGAYTYQLTVIPQLTVSDIQNREKPDFKNNIIQAKPLTQSGAFLVQGGSIVNPNMSEKPSGTMDQVYIDDLIVAGSACVGTDCANNENFGFDTLRLKENNLRIKFDDTSNSGSFPYVDWQLTANESSNGGLNKFSIEDITNSKIPFTIEASAPTNSLYVDDGGRVGFGTSTPAVEAHIVDGDTPTLRLEQDGSSGFTAQTWDVAGNETNFFVRDATNGSKIPFKIKPNAPTNSIFVDSDGDIGFGTQSITAGYSMYLKTGSSENAVFVAERTSGAAAYITATASEVFLGSVTNSDLKLAAGGNAKMTIDTSGGITMLYGNGTYNSSTGQWVDASSRQYKENIKELNTETAMETLKKLNPVTFKMKTAADDDYQVGFIAEDVPELVAQKNRKGLAAMDIVAVLTKVVKEQQDVISQLKSKIVKIEKNQ